MNGEYLSLLSETTRSYEHFPIRNFVDDGMQCQLSKLKRLWKRMKDTARQNIIKYNDQKKRGIRSPKQPTDLDTEVADLIAFRNVLKSRLKPKKNSKMKNKPAPNRMVSQVVKQEIDNEEDEEDEEKYEYEEHNGFPMEPMTILEELESKQPTISSVQSYAMNGHNQVNRSQDPLDEEEDAVIEESYDHIDHTDDIRKNRPKDIQKELVAHEIKLRELQRQNEEEKMEFEREIFRKRSALLDLKMRKITLELEVLEGNRSKSSGFNHNTDDDEN